MEKLEKQVADTRNTLLRAAVEAWRAGNGLNRKQTAALLDVPQASFSTFTTGKLGLGKFEDQVIEGIGMDPADLESRVLQAVYDARMRAAGERGRREEVPILGQVFAGKADNPVDGVRVPDNWPMDGSEVDPEHPGKFAYISDVMYEDAMRDPRHAVFGAVVEGDSMEPYYLPDDVLLVERIDAMEHLRAGDHVVVHLGNGRGYVIKQFESEPEPYLLSINRKDVPIFLRLYPDHAFYGRVCGMYRPGK